MRNITERMKALWNRSLFGKVVLILWGIFAVLLLTAILINLDLILALGPIMLILVLVFTVGPMFLVLMGVTAGGKVMDVGYRQYQSSQESAGDAVLEAVEKERMKIQLRTAGIVAAGILVSLLGLPQLLILFGFAAIVSYALGSIRYSRQFGENITLQELQKNFRDVSFQTEGSHEAAQDMLLETRFLALGDEANVNNILSGTFEGLHFRSADLEAFRVTEGAADEDGSVRRSYHNVGRYRLYTLNYAEPFPAAAVAAGRGFRTAVPEQLGLTEVPFRSGSALFEDHYRVYAEHADAAGAVLKPQLVEAMAQIADRFRDTPFCFGMRGNVLYAAQNITKKNVLSPDAGVYKTLKEQREELAKEIDGIREVLSWFKNFGETV